MHADNVDAPVVEQRRTIPGSRWFAWLALGFVFLLVVPWLQRTFWLAQCPGQIGGNCDGQWDDLRWTFVVETLLSIGVVLVCAKISGVLGVDRITAKIVSYIENRTNWWTAVIVVTAILLPLSAAWFVLDRFPNSGDEYSYLFEARTLAGFRLWEAPPVLGSDLIPYRTWILDFKWVSQYPPGWPMVLAGGLLLGLPAWMMNALLGGASVAALVALCRRVGDRSATVVAVALFTLTPFFVMNAASYFPHVFSSLLILLFCLCLLPDGENVRSHKLVAAGAIVGMTGNDTLFRRVAAASGISLVASHAETNGLAARNRAFDRRIYPVPNPAYDLSRSNHRQPVPQHIFCHRHARSIRSVRRTT